MPALATASGSIALKTNPAITHFDLPALTEVDGTFTVGDPCCGSTGNSSLTVINVPLLALVKGTFAVANNSVLNSVVAPSLTEIDGGFAVQQNPDLSDCAMIALAAQTNVADPQIYQNLNDVSSCS